MPSIEHALQSLIKEYSHSFKNGQATYPEDFGSAEVQNNTFIDALLSQNIFIAINKIQGQDSIFAIKESSGSPAMPCFTSKEELYKYFKNINKKFDYIHPITGTQAFKNAGAMNINVILNPSSEHTIVFPAAAMNSTLTMHNKKDESIPTKSKIAIKIPSSQQYVKLQTDISNILDTINEIENAYLVLIAVGNSTDYHPTIVIELNVLDNVRREYFKRIISFFRDNLKESDDFDLTCMGDDLAFDSTVATRIKPFHSRKKRMLH